MLNANLISVFASMSNLRQLNLVFSKNIMFTWSSITNLADINTSVFISFANYS